MDVERGSGAGGGGGAVRPSRLLGSTRLSLSIIGFFMFFHLYAQRVGMSVAIVGMVNQTAVSLMSPAGINHCSSSTALVTHLISEAGHAIASVCLSSRPSVRLFPLCLRNRLTVDLELLHASIGHDPVSYTHLTLPTNREV